MRKNRIRKSNATYHTSSRCINLENMMKNDSIKELMLDVLQETVERYQFQLNGFTIMDNHFDFVIKTISKGEDISKIMQRIKSVFARRYNKMHGRTGPFWNERFSSKIIELMENAAECLLQLLWHIAAPFQIYKKIEQVNNRYSSIGYYLDESYRSRVSITLHEAFMNLGKNFSDRVKAFNLIKQNTADTSYQ